MAMSLKAVIGSLQHDAAMQMAEAQSTPDYGAVIVHLERARRLRAMADAVRLAEAGLVVPPGIPAAKVRKPATGAPRAAVVAFKPAKMGALAFWGVHGQAVQAISAEFGLNWKVAAPAGQTELATIPARWCSYIGERGTKIRWPADQRLPAAKYWPGGVIPDGVEIRADYLRVAKPFRRTAWKRPVWHVQSTAAHRQTPAWHKAHGYAWDGKAWVSELGYLASLAHEEGIGLEREAFRLQRLELACRTYGPQPVEPFADIADDMALSEAAD